MQVSSNVAVLVEQVFDCVLHGVVGGSNDTVLCEVHCGLEHKTISEESDVKSATRSMASCGELTIQIKLFVHAALLQNNL